MSEVPAAPREIWFARAQTPSARKTRLVPVHWKGYAAFGVFAGAMLVGGLIFALCAYGRLYALGISLYILSTLGGVGWLVFALMRHSDLTRTSLDYKKTDA